MKYFTNEINMFLERHLILNNLANFLLRLHKRELQNLS